MRITVVIRLLIVIVCLMNSALPVLVAYGEEPVRIGVLAFRPKPQTLAQWQPLARALKQVIPGRDFVVMALSHSELEFAIAGRQLDFVLTNPGHYVLLKKRNGLSSPLATLAVNEKGRRSTAFGGVIFCRAEETDISALSDLKGKNVAAVGSEALGSYQMQAYELSRAGIRPPRGDKLLTTGLPQDKVVNAVLAGRAAVGFVRTGVLEGMVRDGKLDMKRIKIINSQLVPDYPFQLSTRLYPEWPFTALPHIDDNLAKHVSAALFMLKEDSPIARVMGLYGFAVPADYTPVEELLRELRLPPFEAAPVFTPYDIWARYRWQMLLASLAGGVILLLGLRLLAINRTLEEKQRIVELQTKELFDSKGKLLEQNNQLQATEDELHMQIDEYKAVQGLLCEAKVAAESASTTKSEFLANMSHELRTPMNGVIGMSQLLEYTDLTQEQQEYVTALKISGENMLSLINDILDLSKIEAGKVKIELAEFSLQHCVNDIILMQKIAAFEKKLTLEVDLADNIPNVLVGDQLRIKQILLNLLGNAVKFTDRGKVTLTARIIEQGYASVFVQIAVRDTGIGIASDALVEIFKPFTQEDGSTTRRYGGTGLGLTISRRLALLMGGSLAVESTLGVGSCFTVTLPFSIHQSSVIAAVDDKKNVVSRDSAALRVLLVEDNPVNTVFGTSVLKKLGHDSVAVTNGLECLAALEQGVFDLVLMDIQMPVMNGEDALKAIRQRKQGADIPVIALTAYALNGDQERFMNAGFNGYISKPYDTGRLVAEIERVMG